MHFRCTGFFIPGLFTLKSDRSAPLFGFTAGILGGLFNVNGPPLVVYGTLRGWNPEKFRATLQGCLFPAGLMIVLGHGSVGLWTGGVLFHFAVSLPFIFAGIAIGGKLNRKIPTGRFDAYVYGLLVVLGLALVIETVL